MACKCNISVDDRLKTSGKMNFLPIVVNITGKRILIIGAGNVGFHKATILTRFSDNIEIIAAEFKVGFEDLPLVRHIKEYEPSDLEDMFLVYACTENAELNRQIKEDGNRMGVLVSVCDNLELCDFISPAIFKQDNVTIAVSSNGQNVCQSVAIRNRISSLIEEGNLKLK